VCAEPSPPREETLLAFARFGPPDGAVFLRGRGCGECKHRGFRGRTAILELMPLDRALRELVAAGAPTDSLREAALARGMHSLMESGFAKASRGQTTLEEVLRVCHSED
jgi:type II secretory ATPase GspE/PulE/Tfp pilus assembly ATPase PilB-like protein